LWFHLILIAVINNPLMKRIILLIIIFVVALVIWLTVNNKKTSSSPTAIGASSSSTISQTPKPTTSREAGVETIESTSQTDVSKNLVLPYTFSLNQINNSGYYGTATIFKDSSGHETISLDVVGDSNQTPKLVNIYEGDCQNPFRLRYGLNPFQGDSTTTIFDKVGTNLINSNTKLALLISRSTAVPDDIIACGQIK
jgi:hypothetical protein